MIVVFVEHGGSGGRVAWPIARQILEAQFGKHGDVKPEPPKPAKQAKAVEQEGD